MKQLALILMLLSATAACGGDDSTAYPISEKTLSGKFNGNDWSYVQADTDPFFSDDKHHTRIYDSAYTACDAFSRPTNGAILVQLPMTTGDWQLGSERSVTFFVPPSDNIIATDGRIAVYEITDTTIKAGINAEFDPAFKVDGRFEVGICPP